MTINELKKDIKKQREINIELFNSIPVASHEDPNNEKAQPILAEWRKGSENLKFMLKQLQELESKENIKIEENRETFVNGFGEATKRYVTNQTYNRMNKRNQKSILSFLGCK